MPKAIKIKTTREELEKLYIEQNMSKDDLCKYFNVGKEKMRLILREYNIVKPKKLSAIIRKQTQIEKTGFGTYMESPRYKRMDISKNLLRELYINQNLSIDNVAQQLKCSRTLIKTKLKEFEIKKTKDLKNKLREETNKKRYGVTHNSQTKEWVNKTKSTCMYKYGNTCYLQSEKGKKLVAHIMVSKYGVDKVLKLKEFQLKAHNTKKSNNSYGKSIEENKIYEYLKNKYPDIIRQYSDDRYPFPCDFYIPSRDLFIEYQGHWRHGGHPFNENNLEDQKKLQLWKKKAEYSTYYQSCIKCWTLTDPLKRKVAKRNSIKLLELWKTRKGGIKKL